VVAAFPTDGLITFEAGQDNIASACPSPGEPAHTPASQSTVSALELNLAIGGTIVLLFIVIPLISMLLHLATL
jgi:hypothetical protein